ncbi:MAG: hypothetical protein PHW88_04455 [Bacteroidales bacterium]|nr:DUF2271 domain-containing protein [Bacteroidales bacterium]MDD2330375.1 hypothetical protein [Bacteroidales bacterium]MDD2771540.1 hypothetical protein [Bacteroidales bacterium]MDD3105274.1 hypothetical protein [Bacteroidales bacterium]MDD3549691.1 hypothetical protein [Bacteroidales bacterium]
MKARNLVVAGITALGVLTSCDKDLVTYKEDDIKVLVTKGDEWLHDFPAFLGINKKNPPQIAIWVEDLAGNYLTTIYASHKIATESWQSNGGNRRKESLPTWCYARGVQYPDGLYLPTKSEPLVDGISGATPHGSFDVKMCPVGDLKQFVVKIELNHSTDWNDNYPKNAKEGDANYSGGKEGSGQPAVVYSAEIDLDSNRKQYTATIIGHSSPDGSNGNIYSDTSSLTSALNIAKEITINIQ